MTFAKPSFVVTKREFSKVICIPFERAFSITNIKAGFLKCGIYPFNPGAVERAKMLLSGSYSHSESISSGDSSEISSPVPTSLLEGSSSSSSCPLSTNATPSSSAATPQLFDSLTPNTSVTSAAGNRSLLSVSPPPPMVSLIDSLSGSEVRCSTPTLNPLVVAGLIPSSLADILVTPPVTKEPTKRITGARDLTANEYYECLQGEEKKKEAAELKQKKLEEWQRKKEEKEEERKRKQEEKKKRQQAAEENLRAKPARKQLKEECSTSVHRKLSMTGLPDEEEHGPCANLRARPKQRCQLPARFRDSNSESDDGVLCSMCNQKEPAGRSAETIFWIDCDVCGAWVHTYCAFKNNGSSHRYMCKSCI